MKLVLTQISVQVQKSAIESVVIFESNVTPIVKANSDILTALAVLGNWQLSAADLFGWLNFS